MSLPPGTRIGPYEVTGRLGAGGMGEVYRARDDRLGRDVALKVLPDTFARDPERLARFQREAMVLASLTHPNVGAIYGLEESLVLAAGGGSSRSVRALVLELVEGETLADRLAHDGPIPIAEVLPIARQLADALEAAHEHGIVHRDLKPANIKVTPDGVVMVLDFGIAKLSTPTGEDSPSVSIEKSTTGGRPDVTASPTMMTGIGIILGTAAYMAPEQAKGRPADRRSDLWAFGCVVFEMLSGVNPFKGEDVSETLAFILTRDPDWSLLPAGTPVQIRRLLQRALQRDRRRRLADAADARLEVDEAMTAGVGESAPLAAVPAVWGLRTALIVAALVAATAALTAAVVWQWRRPEAVRVARLTITPSADAPLTVGGTGRSVAITPDGSRVVYRAAGAGLMVRSLDSLEAMPLAGVGNALQPFISPDGEWVGFFEGLALRKVALSGGPGVTLSRLDGPGALGASWGEDGTIVFATSQAATGLQQVSADGGNVTTLTTPDRARNESDHAWPSHLPGGRGVLFTIVPLSGDLGTAEIAVLAPGTTAPKVLIRGGSFPRYVESGHIVYLAGTDLRAVAFNLASLELAGDPVSIETGVRTTLPGAADFDVAADGTLVYVAGGSQVAAPPRTLAWIDRSNGREEDVPLSVMPARQYSGLAIAADGNRVAIDVREEANDIWIWDIARETFTRLTFGPSTEWWPVWMPDGRRVVFGSNQAGASSVYIQAADGSGRAQRVTQSMRDHLPTSVSPDGKRIIFEENSDTFDLLSVTLDPIGPFIPLLQTPFDERNGAISPDGRWLALQSTESGRPEIYVRPFPDTQGGRWQVSTSGGALPLWSPVGDELFYMTSTGTTRGIMAVRVEQGLTWTAGRPVTAAQGSFMQGNALTYGVSRDGRRFLVIKQGAAPAPATAGPAPTIVVVQHWFDELRGRFSTP